MVPERASVTEFSTKFLEYGRFYVTRVSRKSPYFMNVEGTSKHQWGNNVTVNVLFFEYLHNEYRRSFVEIHGRLCDLLNKDPLIGVMFKNRGIECPIKQCVILVPERGKVSEFSTKFFESARFFITRFGRKSPYFFNIEFLSKHQWGNNVTIDIIFYEYLHNEYRRSFVEIHARLCDLINKDPLLGVMYRNRGIKCPAKPGKYTLLNLTLPIEDFPYQFPFTKFRVDGELIATDTKELMAKGYCYASFKNK